jgi:pimeloyl-ACP methyl ester carboxylesterase
MDAVPALRQFQKPVLIVWGEKDTNFGPDIGTRLARDIPGTKGIYWLNQSAHLPMLEQAGLYSAIATRFFTHGTVAGSAQEALLAARR